MDGDSYCTAHDQLLKISEEQGVSLSDVRFAQLLDEMDPIKWLRSEFHVPKLSEIIEDDIDLCEGMDGSKECTYLYGNGLGLQPTGTKELVDEEMKKWKCKGMFGYFNGEKPWYSIEDLVKKQSGVLVGKDIGWAEHIS